MPHTFIFDLDGVIADTAKYHFQAWREIASELGIELDDQDNEKLKGVGRHQSLLLILDMGKKTLSEDAFHKTLDRKNNIYLSYAAAMNESDALPGVRRVLEHLKLSGRKIALGSASRNAKMIMKKIELTAYFDVIVDGNMVSATKPDPEVFLLGARLTGTSPSDCIVFEDALTGLKAAKSAGMTAVGIGRPEVLKEADYIFAEFDEITEEFLNSL